MLFENLSLLEVLAPFWKNLQTISDETSSFRLMKNNEELIDNPEKYNSVLESLGLKNEG
jgi:hypothetical protein